MTRIASHPPRQKPPPSPLELGNIQHIVLEDASWETYEQLLRDIGDRPIRINYDQGRLEMMSPLPEPEEVKGIICRLIQTLSDEMGIEIKSLGAGMQSF